MEILRAAIEKKGRKRAEERSPKDLMSAHRGSAGSTRHPATSEMRDLMSDQLGFCAGSTRDPAT